MTFKNYIQIKLQNLEKIYLLLLLGFFLRIGFILLIHVVDFNANWMAPDSYFYVELAKNFIQDGIPISLGNSLISYLISSFHFIKLVDLFSNDYVNKLLWLFQSFNIFWSTLSILILYKTSKAIFNENISLLATFIFAVYPYNLFWNGFILKESFGVFLFLLNLYNIVNIRNFFVKEKFFLFKFIFLILFTLISLVVTFYWRKNLFIYFILGLNLYLLHSLIYTKLFQTYLKLSKLKAIISIIVIICVTNELPFFKKFHLIALDNLYTSTTVNYVIKGNGYVEFISLDKDIKYIWEKPPFDGTRNSFEKLSIDSRINLFIEGIKYNLINYPLKNLISLKLRLINYYRPFYEDSSTKNILFFGVFDGFVMILSFCGFFIYFSKQKNDFILISFFLVFQLIQIFKYSEIRYRIYDMPIYILFTSYFLVKLKNKYYDAWSIRKLETVPIKNFV